ncbi:hypothetical protein PHYBLDRAFT_150023 [Phycomyces blakesleeanus NRRL 1555(-)]|uniref:ADF-H domain-containing protein n=1 Tax=Phycomyces blakesleeanus (strain ATCC 8743b / DSM 1359 / FGSC 10004 / NBRC 33097 / NRRL 1555) TaxID=763407 RepID=A0A162WMA6_PHYB8|nr:hypothetical protein PHYBLDRAFT_150023 [Phycomyces blakesleeanus NRRL 1555(-)]OAD69025.1 hypothetical protein PHYBLDRAFT_150023 [Phycomyces blakesleeanus NRRL 1555(-)]|eukprot:XP_018287065.1 hypothetical protein PHYBLDRAFT_150023 [Phycomyces blakesleeanus NRRL 1555(-)]
MSSSTCEIDSQLLEKIKKFRFAKYSSGNAAFVLQIDRKQLKIVEEEVYDAVSLEELIEELPENSPRFIILSYERKYSDGRVNYPLLFIYWSPSSAKAEINMLYASAKTFVQEKTDVTRGVDIRDPESFTDEYILKHLG